MYGKELSLLNVTGDPLLCPTGLCVCPGSHVSLTVSHREPLGSLRAALPGSVSISSHWLGRECPDWLSWVTCLPHLLERWGVGIGSLPGSQGFLKEVRLASATTLPARLCWGEKWSVAWEPGAELSLARTPCELNPPPAPHTLTRPVSFPRASLKTSRGISYSSSRPKMGLRPASPWRSTRR